ncbi:MAG: hypothetical protein ACI9N3_000772 [Colwellia sp.]|jgi:hypothetical protein
MEAIMSIENLKTIEDLDSFIQGNQIVAFTVLGDKNGSDANSNSAA